MDYTPKYRILLVDDNAVFLKALRLQLHDILPNQIDYIDEVYDGLAAIESVNKRQYGIIFMDIDMPKMNGIDATKYINLHFPQILVVAISMYNDFQYLDRMFQAGSVSYISKDTLDDEVLIKIFDSIAQGSF